MNIGRIKNDNVLVDLLSLSINLKIIKKNIRNKDKLKQFFNFLKSN